MAKRNRILITEERICHRYYDKTGKKQFEVWHITCEWSENGRDVTEIVVEHREPASGPTVEATPRDHQGQGQPPMQTCDLCELERRLWLFGLLLFHRRRPRTNMSQAATMERCYNCRATLCQDHSCTSRFDGRVRCPWCDMWHWLYRKVVKWALFTK
jgi:hypothetical protein